jgi:LmbE family N-acetylglucosaminyl deacetylase
MFGFSFLKKTNRPATILCLGAHCDDIEIGCGGTVLRLIREIKDVKFHWIVFSSVEKRKTEGIRSANQFLRGSLSKSITIHDFRDSFFPYIGAEIKQCMEKIRKEVNPDLVFTHYRDDLHQDHRIIGELTWNAFRNHLILEYEVPKYDGDLGSPNFFVPIEYATCTRKVRNIIDIYRTQRSKHWFTKDLFLAILRIRGMEAGCKTRYAEAFYSRKIVIGTLDKGSE